MALNTKSAGERSITMAVFIMAANAAGIIGSQLFREDDGPEWTRMPIARLRYAASQRLWTLYYHRHTGRWERYPLLGPSRRLTDLLSEIAEDPICVFWG